MNTDEMQVILSTLAIGQHSFALLSGGKPANPSAFLRINQNWERLNPCQIFQFTKTINILQ
jgi:hypothetical protein